MRTLRLGPILGARQFHSQHRTPIIPQVRLPKDDRPNAPQIRVGYFLHRNQIVKHTPHPLEIEMSYLLEREHQRYSRHEGSESALQFMTQRGQTIDILGRTDPNQIKSNFFGLDLYQDAMKAILQRYAPEKRVTKNDLWDPEALESSQPPKRHSLHRKLDDFLYLIIQEEESSKWTVPSTSLSDRETLRMAVDRAICTHHDDGLDCYIWSNAPQATISNDEEKNRMFIYSATYLSGRPKFSGVEPKIKDHAWVSRDELWQYRDHFKHPDLISALIDIAADSTFEG